jgi:hypothetical protein
MFSSASLNPGMRRPNPGMRRLGGFAAGLALLAGTALTVITAPAATAAPGTAAPAAAPRLSHAFLIMEENNGFQDVIGNKAAPNLNYLAKTFGLETNYFGVSPCCSESNYVQLLGGTSFPIVQSDDAYWKNMVVGTPSMITQLDHAGISWKAYLQSLPYPGYQGICYPAKCNGAPDSDPLYVSKHDGIQNWSNLYGVAIAGGSVWAAGTYIDPVTDNNDALVLREADGSWVIAGAPNPGSGSNLPGGLTVINGQLWLAGVYDNGDSRLPLIASR